MQSSSNISNLRIKFTEKYADIKYDIELPISKRIEEIADIINKNQVTIISGATGCGKTTQIPKICLQLGRGVKGLIGHTQPRKIAATSIAKRLASELGVENVVGYQIRFHDTCSKEAYIKVMTDGILLAEISHDKYLKKYDTIIIDEAHERSLNIDFLLGYIKKILPKRPDLKIIITSATIDTQIFSKHFNNAAIIEVEGKTYPIKILYRPLESLEEIDLENKTNLTNSAKNAKLNKIEQEQSILQQAILNAIDEVQKYAIGDVLIFLAGEREIKEVADYLIQAQKNLPIHKQKIILPLYSRLSLARQDIVFNPHGQQVRIVLATNVAETSITVPRIKYVIDVGNARIKRYSFRQKLDQLNIEKISQASANQRSGRCGRVSEGVCIRLYSQNDFEARSLYTEPEILRSSLANVMLKMLSMNLGDITQFDFIQKPSNKAIHDAKQILYELGAIDNSNNNHNHNQLNNLTNIGKILASFPLDIRIARMLIASKEYNCVKEILIIASNLGLQDIKEYPHDINEQKLAKLAHAKFKDINSGFNEKIILWQETEKIIKERKSWSEVKAWCKKNFISFMRLKEWREMHMQLLVLVQNKGWQINHEDASFEQIHKAILSGLISNIGMYNAEKQYYMGAYNLKFFIHPSTNIDKKKPNWIMAGEIIETNKIYARTIAKIESKWLEQIAPHLIKKTTINIVWYKDRGEVIAKENAALFGLPIYQQRAIAYINKNIALDKQSEKITQARELFIRHALVMGEINTKFKFLTHNLNLVEQLQKLENKARRQDILVNDEVIEEFYNKYIPNNIYSEQSFKDWYKNASAKQEKILYLDEEEITDKPLDNAQELFPKYISINNDKYRLSYRFEVGHALDGITLHIPLAKLNQLDLNHCDWLVKGIIKEKIIALIKTLPQKQRKVCVPVPSYAEDFLDRNIFAYGHLLSILAQDILINTNTKIELQDFKPQQLPAHLHMNIKVVDEDDNYIAAGKDIASIKSKLSPQSSQAFDKIMQNLEASILNPISSSNFTDKNSISIKTLPNLPNINHENEIITTWNFDTINDIVHTQQAKLNLTGYPALVDKQTHCILQIFDTKELALKEHLNGIKRLFALQVKDNIKRIIKDFSLQPEVGVNYLSLGNASQLYEQIIDLALIKSFLPTINLQYPQMEALPKNKQEFESLLQAGKPRFNLIVQEIKQLSINILKKYAAINKKIACFNQAYTYAINDIKQQLVWLIPSNFLIAHNYEHLKNFERYLYGIEVRLEKLKSNPQDKEYTEHLQKYQQKWQIQKDLWLKQGIFNLFGDKYIRFMNFPYIWQELRLSLFAQSIKTNYPVSLKRLEKEWHEIINL